MLLKRKLRSWLNNEKLMTLNFTNRSLLLIFPKMPMVEWARNTPTKDSFKGSDEEIAEMLSFSFLVDEEDDPNLTQIVQKHFGTIFDHALEDWYVDRKTWPKINFKTFNDWFEVRFMDEVCDLCETNFEVEKFGIEEEGRRVKRLN